VPVVGMPCHIRIARRASCSPRRASGDSAPNRRRLTGHHAGFGKNLSQQECRCRIRYSKWMTRIRFGTRDMCSSTRFEEAALGYELVRVNFSPWFIGRPSRCRTSSQWPPSRAKRSVGVHSIGTTCFGLMAKARQHEGYLIHSLQRDASSTTAARIRWCEVTNPWVGSNPRRKKHGPGLAGELGRRRQWTCLRWESGSPLRLIVHDGLIDARRWMLT